MPATSYELPARYELNATYEQGGALVTVDATCNSCRRFATANNRISVVGKIVHALSCAYALEDATDKAANDAA